MDFVEICNVYFGKMIIKAAKRIFNSDKMCHSYSDLNFGVTFFGTQCSFASSAKRYKLTLSSQVDTKSLINIINKSGPNMDL